MSRVASSAKAWVALLGPSITVAIGAISDAVVTHHHIPWAVIAATFAVNAWGAVLVWLVPNTPPNKLSPPVTLSS